MEVKISFDTERENIDDLRKLVIALQDLIARREKSSSLGNPIIMHSVVQPCKIKVETPIQVHQAPANGQTAGGGRVIPYEDMSDVLSKICSGRKY